MAIYAGITGRAVRAYVETTDKTGFRLVSEFGRSAATPLRVVFVGNNHYNELVRRDASAASKKRSLEPAKLEGACPHAQSKQGTGPWIEAEEDLECREPAESVPERTRCPQPRDRLRSKASQEDRRRHPTTARPRRTANTQEAKPRPHNIPRRTKKTPKRNNPAQPRKGLHGQARKNQQHNSAGGNGECSHPAQKQENE